MCTNKKKTESHIQIKNILEIFDLWNGILMKTEDGKKGFLFKKLTKKTTTATEANNYSTCTTHTETTVPIVITIIRIMRKWTYTLQDIYTIRSNLTISTSSLLRMRPSYFQCFKPMHSLTLSLSLSHFLSFHSECSTVSIMSCLSFFFRLFLQVPFLWKY